MAKRDKMGREDLEMMNSLAAIKQAGFDIPDNVMETFQRRLPGVFAQTQTAVATRELDYGLDDLSINKLKTMCKEQGLPTSGTRAKLIERLS